MIFLAVHIHSAITINDSKTPAPCVSSAGQATGFRPPVDHDTASSCPVPPDDADAPRFVIGGERVRSIRRSAHGEVPMYLPWLKRTHFAFSLSVLFAVLAITLLGSRADAARKDIQTLGVPVMGWVGGQRANADILAEEQRHEGEPTQADPLWR